MNSSYIAGEWQQSNSSTQTIENINPSNTNDVIGAYAQADDALLQRAIDAAQQAQRTWKHVGLEQRQAILHAIGEEMMERALELGTLLSREEGKPIVEGKGEVYRAGQFFTYYAAEVLRQIGDLTDSVRAGVEVLVQREPIGVVAVISPWNFPTATAVWKIAPALAFGNAVIWKPANLVPASAVAVAEIIDRQTKNGLPKGLFNLVIGSGREIGQGLVDSSGINAISFTGSVEVGKSIGAAAMNNLTKVQMEMGSKNALVVMDDADMDTAVACALNGAFGSTGQKCTASSRLVVHEKVHDEFVERIVKGAKALVVGDALDDKTQMGPVSSESQLNQNMKYVELATKEGAELAYGGEHLELDSPGFYMSPTIYTNTNNAMQINRDEVFAPLTCIIKVDAYEQAVDVVNDTDFGLTSGIITQSLARANHFRHHAQTGCVMINLPTAGTDYHVPFGGRGNSSYGPREQGQYAAEFYTTVKTTYMSAGPV